MKLSPIGVFRSSPCTRYALPRQAGLKPCNKGWVELVPGQNFEMALQDLEGFDRIWLIFIFHDSRDYWRPKVMPPRSEKRRGVFATRSPHRPNPIGLSCVQLLGISKRILEIRGHDLLDGTPILDIKPYLIYADSHPGSRQGWIDDCENEPVYEVLFSENAENQLSYLLGSLGVEINAHWQLAHYPYPRKGRRIWDLEDGSFILAYKSWRLHFQRDDGARVVTVLGIYSGYRSFEGPDTWGDFHLHREFLKCFPEFTSEAQE